MRRMRPGLARELAGNPTTDAVAEDIDIVEAKLIAEAGDHFAPGGEEGGLTPWVVVVGIVYGFIFI